MYTYVYVRIHIYTYIHIYIYLFRTDAHTMSIIFAKNILFLYKELTVIKTSITINKGFEALLSKNILDNFSNKQTFLLKACQNNSNNFIALHKLQQTLQLQILVSTN